MAAEWLRNHYGMPDAADYFGIPYGKRGIGLPRSRDGVLRFVADEAEPAQGQGTGDAEYPAPTAAVDGRPMAGSDWYRWMTSRFPRTYP
jgi:hypothetical protein